MADITVRSVLAKFGFKIDDASLKKANKSVEDSKKQIDKAEQAAKKLEGEFGKMASAAERGFGKTERVAKSLGVQLDKTGQSAGGLSSKLSALASGAVGGLAAAASIEGIKKIGEFFSVATDRTAQLDAAMAVLPGGIDRAVEATGGLADNFSLATAGATALRAGLVADGTQFGEFAGDTARLARAAGDNVGEAVSRMVEELKGGSTALLEQYGVTVDAEAAVESYAAAHNKLAEDLTETEKRHAVVAAAMSGLRASAAALGDQVASDAERVQQAAVRWSNFKDDVQTSLVSAAGSVLLWQDEQNRAAAEAEQAWQRQQEAIRDLQDPLRDARLTFDELANALTNTTGGMRGLGETALDTAANIAFGVESVRDLQAAVGTLMEKIPSRLRVVKDQDGNVVSTYEDTSAEPYQMTDAEKRAQKRLEQERQAHEDEAAYQRLFYGPEAPPQKKGGAAKPGPAYELRSLQMITGATGDTGDAVSELLAGYKQGKTAKKLSVEELYDRLKRSRDPKAKQDARAQLDRHFLDLVTGGSPAGVGGPSSGGAQGLGTRIVNVDARITADIDVVAPEGLVGAGEVEGRRVAQTLGRDIAEQLDPYFADQATVIRRAVEG